MKIHQTVKKFKMFACKLTGKTGQNWKGKIQSWTSEIKSQDLKLNL